MTTEQQRELARLAVQVALEAPYRGRSGPTVSVSINWSTVETIRAACEASGIDWRQYHPRKPTKGSGR